MTLQDKVQSYIGTFSDTNSLTSWLVESVTDLVNRLPNTVLEIYSSSLSDAGSGISIAGYKVLRAHKNGYGAQIVSASLKSRIADSGSIYYASSTDPTAYIENGTGYIKPLGGAFITFQYPVLTYASIAASTQFLKDFEDHITLPVCIRAIKQLISTAEVQHKTYLESDEDTELANAELNRVESYSVLLKTLTEQYDNLMKGL